MDEQEYVRKILKSTLRWIHDTVNDEDEVQKERAKAAKLGLEYTRLAANILRLDVKKRPAPFEDVEPMTAEELKRCLLIELEHVDKYLLPPANPNSTPDVTRGESRDELRGASDGVVTPPRMPAETSREADVADATDAQAVPGADAVPDAQGAREKHRRVAPDLNKTRMGSYVSDFPLTRPAR